jgi:TonB family protein
MGQGTGSGRSALAGSGPVGPRRPVAEAVEDYTRLVPPYSDEAIDSDVSGAVSLRLEIDETGRVTDASVVRGFGHGLDRLAVETGLRYRFRPATDDQGRPIRSAIGWNIVWEPYWKRLFVKTIVGHPNCRGHGPLNLDEYDPAYIDCDAPAGPFDLSSPPPPRRP